MSAILTLSITREAPGRYMCKILHEGVDVAEPTFHPSVKSAIFDHCDPPAFRGVKGYHVWYCGVYAGTIPIEEMDSRSSEMGEFLPALSRAIV